MTYLAEQQGVAARFAANTTVPSVDYTAFNLPGNATDGTYKPPTVDISNPDAAIWARIQTAPVPRAVAPARGVSHPGPVGIGTAAPQYREGWIVVQHFAPVRTGLQTLLGYVDETRGIFTRAQFGNVICRDADEPEIVGEDDSGEWFQVNVATNYYVLEAVA